MPTIKRSEAVVYKGVKFDPANLPEGVEKKETVPLAEFYKKNRKTGPARKSVSDGETEALRAEIAELRSTVEALTAPDKGSTPSK